ncbi:MAG: DUF3467 domain-containing protein [Candidatus Gracilibacteria bacterium]|jgi:hypothetical protein|nr:DUF3467 domain-containing protein [Candidatus Gracilibacteria bacterium]
MEKGKLTLKVKDELEQGVYANAISVHINPNECVLDFAYQIPNTKDPVLKLVSRVNMNHKTMESFVQIVTNALLDWKNKQKNN